MRGTILAFDFRTAEGKISGEDGVRYSFVGREWHGDRQPRANQQVDFEISDFATSATAIYPLRTSLNGGTLGTHRSRIAAALLAFFLGFLGAHKFYMGKMGAGAVMLVIAIFGSVLAAIPTLVIAVIALVECVIYLSMTDEAFVETYVNGDRDWF